LFYGIQQEQWQLEVVKITNLCQDFLYWLVANRNNLMSSALKSHQSLILLSLDHN